VFPVRYELNLHMLFSIHSVFKKLKTEIYLNNKLSVPTAQNTQFLSSEIQIRNIEYEHTSDIQQATNILTI
jgi:hypothetical protein